MTYNSVRSNTRERRSSVQWISIALKKLRVPDRGAPRVGDRGRRARAYFEFECGEYRMASSAEPGRRKAYDCDLRWRMIYQWLARGLHYKDIGRNLDVSTSTVYHTYNSLKLQER